MNVGKTVIVGNVLGGFTYGIWLFNSADNAISGNILTTGNVGIRLEANSDYNVIGNNRILSCTWGATFNAATEDKNILVANGLVGNTNAWGDNGTGTVIANNTI